MKLNTIMALALAVLFSNINLLNAQSGSEISGEQAENKWSIGFGGGWILYEGDEAVRDGSSIFLRAAYDYSPRWTFRADLSLLPHLSSNSVYNYESGEPVPRYGLSRSSTWALGLSGDALFHLNARRSGSWDPYLIGGIGLMAYADSRNTRSQVDVPIRAGLGLAYSISDEWTINLDVMGQMTLDKTEFNFMPSAGLAWRWGTPASLGFFVERAREPRPAPARPAARPSVREPTAKELVPAENILEAFEVDMNIDEGAWRPEYLSELNAVAKAIQAHPTSKVRIEGHVDRQPKYSERDALRLTQKKADEVRDFLVKKHGIARRRITAVGFGFSRPKKLSASEGVAPENRRMEILILAPGQ